MKRFFAAGLLAFAAFSSVAAERCEPAKVSQTSQATPAVWGLTAPGGGAWSAWYCNESGTWVRYVFHVAYADLTPAMIADVQKLSAQTVDGAFVSQMVKAHLTRPNVAPPAWVPLDRIEALRPSDAEWRTAKNGTTTTRPTYPVQGNARLTRESGRVAVGALCDCQAIRIVDGKSTYCRVAELSVAVCVPHVPQ